MENSTFVSHSNPSMSQTYFTSAFKFHVYFMGALWSPLANLAIFIVIYNYRKYWIWLHNLFFAFATTITLACSIPIIMKKGISCTSVKNMFATTALFLITLNTVLGIVTRILNICGAKSSTIIKIKKMHKYCGYLAVLSCKLTTFIKS